MHDIQVEQGAGGGSWPDDQTRQHLQVLVEGVATLAGFEQSAVSLRRESVFELVAAAGLDDSFLGRRLPVESVEGELATADEWGAWLFVPADRANQEVLEYSSIPDVSPVDADDAWHPLNLLVAPLLDDEGRLRGLLSVDSPRNGRLPGPEQLEVLTKYAGVARTLVLLALERESLAERVRLADEAREIVRRALGEASLDLVVEACRSTLASCFGAVGMWLTAFDEDGGTSTTSYSVDSSYVEPPFAEIDGVVIALARRYWADQYVAHFSGERLDQPGLPRREAERLLAVLDGLGVGSVLFVPLGVGTECLGFVVLTRVNDTPAWTSTERLAALDIGRDLGRAVANARQMERERAVADRLRLLDAYRMEMVNTLGHELRTPLFSMTANLELLDVDSLDEEDRRSVAAASRGAARMQAVIEDLLAMAQVADPLRDFVPERVDLRQVLLDVIDECRSLAEARSQACVVEVPDDPVLVPGRPEELHWMLSNLASNASKYSYDGGRIDVRLTQDGDGVRVTFADAGIGISDVDQENLFREFFRSTNPDALARPGTGLGLSIVERIVRRHSGHIELASELGRGTTVTVTIRALEEEPGPGASSVSVENVLSGSTT